MPKYSILFGLILIVYGIAFYVHAANTPANRPIPQRVHGEPVSAELEEHINADVAASSKKASATALIPAYFGIVFLLIGVVSLLKDSLRKHLMHLAALLALIGMGGSFPGLWSLIKAIQGKEELARPMAAFAQSGMFVLLLVFLILCIRSFVQARLLRK